MRTDDLELNEDEVFLLKTAGVTRGVLDGLGNELVLTDHAVIYVKRGMLGRIKEMTRYPLEEIEQPNAQEDSTGLHTIGFCFGRKWVRFGFPQGNKRTTRLWMMAINDRYSDEGYLHDADYYDQFSDENIIRAAEQDSYSTQDDTEDGAELLKGLAKSFIKTGSIGGAIKSQAKKQFRSTLSDALMTNSEMEDLQDEFTEIGNEFREAFGLRPKETNAGRREKALDYAFDQQVRRAALADRAARDEARRRAAREEQTYDNIERMSVSEQIEALRKLKDLLDEGVLTQEEFDAKKAEIMRG